MKDKLPIARIVILIVGVCLFIWSIIIANIGLGCLAFIFLYQAIMNVGLSTMHLPQPFRHKEINDKLENTEYEEIQ